MMWKKEDYRLFGFCLNCGQAIVVEEDKWLHYNLNNDHKYGEQHCKIQPEPVLSSSQMKKIYRWVHIHTNNTSEGDNMDWATMRNYIHDDVWNTQEEIVVEFDELLKDDPFLVARILQDKEETETERRD